MGSCVVRERGLGGGEWDGWVGVEGGLGVGLGGGRRGEEEGKRPP